MQIFYRQPSSVTVSLTKFSHQALFHPFDFFTAPKIARPTWKEALKCSFNCTHVIRLETEVQEEKKRY